MILYFVIAGILVFAIIIIYKLGQRSNSPRGNYDSTTGVYDNNFDSGSSNSNGSDNERFEGGGGGEFGGGGAGGSWGDDSGSDSSDSDSSDSGGGSDD